MKLAASDDAVLWAVLDGTEFVLNAVASKHLSDEKPWSVCQVRITCISVMLQLCCFLYCLVKWMY